MSFFVQNPIKGQSLAQPIGLGGLARSFPRAKGPIRCYKTKAVRRYLRRFAGQSFASGQGPAITAQHRPGALARSFPRPKSDPLLAYRRFADVARSETKKTGRWPVVVVALPHRNQKTAGVVSSFRRVPKGVGVLSKVSQGVPRGISSQPIP